MAQICGYSGSCLWCSAPTNNRMKAELSPGQPFDPGNMEFSSPASPTPCPAAQTAVIAAKSMDRSLSQCIHREI